MKFIVDECTGSTVAEWLKTQGFEVISVFDDWRGASDVEILQKAVEEDFIVVTNDRDFGELIFRQNLPHKGVIFLRPKPNNFKQRIVLLERLFAHVQETFAGKFIVIGNEAIRIS
jgi:predicted nuclease of predicted toxin-antitoxin system